MSKKRERRLSDDEFHMALEVLCRVFDTGAEREVYEFRDWYKPSEWLGFSRALGAFIRKRLDEQPHHVALASLAEEWRQRYRAEREKVQAVARSCGDSVSPGVSGHDLPPTPSLTAAARDAAGWTSGATGLLTFEAKVFDRPSGFGIHGGRVSKLFVRRNEEVIFEYDRGGDSPTSEIVALVDALERLVTEGKI